MWRTAGFLFFDVFTLLLSKKVSHNFVWKWLISGINIIPIIFTSFQKMSIFIFYILYLLRKNAWTVTATALVYCEYLMDYVSATFYKLKISTRLHLFWNLTLKIYQSLFLLNNRNLAKTVSAVSRDFRASHSKLCSLKIHWSFPKLCRKFPSRRFCSVYPL